MIRDQDLNEAAIYWAPFENDLFGQRDFESITPVLIKCRWQSSSGLARASDGREIQLTHVAYVNQLVEAGGYLLLSPDLPAAGTDPKDLGAAEIITVYVTKDLDANETLIKASM